MSTMLQVEGEVVKCECGSHQFLNASTLTQFSQKPAAEYACLACYAMHKGDGQPPPTYTKAQAQVAANLIDLKLTPAVTAHKQVEADYKAALAAWEAEHKDTVNEAEDERRLLKQSCPHDWHLEMSHKTCEICGVTVSRSH